jgi:N6-adenosine-specific RNA methylase IME4
VGLGAVDTRKGLALTTLGEVVAKQVQRERKADLKAGYACLRPVKKPDSDRPQSAVAKTAVVVRKRPVAVERPADLVEVPFYRVLLVDPPWQYRDKNANGGRGAAFKYPVLSMDELKAMRVADLADKDAVLYLWITGPMLASGVGQELLTAWGFKPLTMAFTWVKLTQDRKRTSMGLGHTTRSSNEFVLLGKRGKGVPVVDHSVDSTILSPRLGHSEKPPEAIERIMRLHGPSLDLPRVELFARPQAVGAMKGWCQWGNFGDLLTHPRSLAIGRVLHAPESGEVLKRVRG